MVLQHLLLSKDAVTVPLEQNHAKSLELERGKGRGNDGKGSISSPEQRPESPS